MNSRTWFHLTVLWFATALNDGVAAPMIASGMVGKIQKHSNGLHFSWSGTGNSPMNVERTKSLHGYGWSNIAIGITNGQFIDENPPMGAAFYRAAPAAPLTSTFNYTVSAHEYRVPTGVERLNVVAVGGSGGGWSRNTEVGGRGAYVTGTLIVSPGELLTIVVGLKPLQTIGLNDDYAFKGGGASDIRIGGTNLEHRVVVAGGGGGDGTVVLNVNDNYNTGTSPGKGGDAGFDGAAGLEGFPPFRQWDIWWAATGGGGGTQTNGGVGGGGDWRSPWHGRSASGQLGFGGWNGGDGYYGGGGGGSSQSGSAAGGGGGGGSSFADSTRIRNPTFSVAPSRGNGYITLTVAPTPTPTPTPTNSLTPLVNIETVLVGDVLNPADTTGYGAVAYEFAIGKYEVSLAQYAVFLNSVAKTDTYNLYHTDMAGLQWVSGISRSGSSGSYTYSLIGPSGITPDGARSAGNRPVAFISWFDAARFCNWLHNGASDGADTETGAYTLDGAMDGIILKNSGARWWIPSEDEWYKAAYFDPSPNGPSDDYWLYPTRSDGVPGNMIGVAANQANFNNGVYSVTQSSSQSYWQNYLTESGAFSGSGSYYGTFDQGGSVWEWIDAVTPSGNDIEPPRRNHRGGAFTFSSGSMRSTGDRGGGSTSGNPSLKSSVRGFRVTTTAAPLLPTTNR